MIDPLEAVDSARQAGVAIPAFNAPHLPMVEPIIAAIVAEDAVAMVQVARVEWEKFGCGSLEAVADEYRRFADPEHTLLHLDHVPVVDEDDLEVDYLPIIERGLAAGYQSVMVDGCRLPLDDNIAATRRVADVAHGAGIPCEAELGAVLGHESGPMPPYEEIFATRTGFTDVEQARRFAAESGCDWLSVAVGNVHGAVAEQLRHQKKPRARLDVDHIGELRDTTGLPLVLHGGSGIDKEFVQAGIKAGIAKVNIGTQVRQAYEEALGHGGGAAARQAVYRAVRGVIADYLGVSGTRGLLFG